MGVVALLATETCAVENTTTTTLASTTASKNVQATSPISVWITPAGGWYGPAMGGGATFQLALANGLSAGVDLSAAEQFCVLLCGGRLPEKYQAGALLFGYRITESPVFFSVTAGPSWGRGDHNNPEAKPTHDSTCNWMCFDTPPERAQDRGFGFRMQADLAITNRFIGIGGQFHWVYIPDHPYFGVALIVPMGRLR